MRHRLSKATYAKEEWERDLVSALHKNLKLSLHVRPRTPVPRLEGKEIANVTAVQ